MPLFDHAMTMYVPLILFAHAHAYPASLILIDGAFRVAAQHQRLEAADLHLCAFSLAHILVVSAMMRFEYSRRVSDIDCDAFDLASVM